MLHICVANTSFTKAVVYATITLKELILLQKKELVKRYILFVISLFFSALGVAFTKRGELGVSPISSVANIMSYKYTYLSMGSWLIVWNCILIFGQIVILRRKFEIIQLLQFPLSFLFGWFTDVGMWLVSFIPADIYTARLVMVVAGIAILGFGISLSVIASVIMNAGEAFVKAISDSIHKDFGNVKICFDVFCVTMSIVLSLVFFNLTIIGTREGTIISAFLTGVFVKGFVKLLNKPINALLTGIK